MKEIIIVFSFVLALLSSLFYSFKLWLSMDFVDISSNGTLAIFVCIVLSLLLGGCLMTLVFISSRSGYDDQVDHNLEKIFQKHKKF